MLIRRGSWMPMAGDVAGVLIAVSLRVVVTGEEGGLMSLGWWCCWRQEA